MKPDMTPENRPQPVNIEKLAKDVYPALVDNVQPQPTPNIKEADNSEIDATPRLTLVSILSRVFILLIVGAIVGAAFGADAYRASGYFSGLNNIFMGPLIIGLGLLLLAPAYRYIQYWYIYPFVGFFSSNLIISQDNIYTYRGSGISDHMTAGIGIFAVYALLFFVLSIISIATTKYRVTRSGIVGLALVLLVPASIAVLNQRTISSIKHPPPPARAQPLAGVRLTNVYIEYSDFCDSQTFNTYQGKQITKHCVLDEFHHDILSLGGRNSSCTKSYGIQDSTGTITKETGRTPKGVNYTVTSFKSATAKKSDGTVLYGKVKYDYCFYHSPYEYHITRSVPAQDGSYLDDQYPKYATTQAAYQKYPIEVIVDSYAP